MSDALRVVTLAGIGVSALAVGAVGLLALDPWAEDTSKPLHCPEVITETFGEAGPAACSVAWCSSRFEDPLFGVRQGEPLDTLDAYQLSSGGTNWVAWLRCAPY